MSDFTTTRAHMLALATQIVGFAVAFVPSLSTIQQVLIGGGSTALAVAVLLAHAVRNRPTGETPVGAIEDLVKQELGKIDFNAIAKDALASQNIGQLVQGELSRILSAAAGSAPATVEVSAPAASAPPAP